MDPPRENTAASCRNFVSARSATYIRTNVKAHKNLDRLIWLGTARATDKFALCESAGKIRGNGRVYEPREARSSSLAEAGNRGRSTRRIHSPSPSAASTRTDTVIRRRVIINLRRARAT